MNKPLLMLAIVLAGSPVLAADAPEPAVRLSCRSEPSPGRVLCELEIEVRSGRLAWGDALVVGTPAFARPLRSRVGVREATTKTERRLELPLAFVATETGEGEIEVLARAVLCTPRPESSRELCLPRTTRARTAMVVGAVQQVPR